MFCQKCGIKHPASINYCPNDGQDLQPVLAAHTTHRTAGYCGSCGKALSPIAQYCQHCGESHSSVNINKTADDLVDGVKDNFFSLPAIAGLSFSKKSIVPVLVAVGITIMLTFLAALVLKTQVENFIVDNSFGEITKVDFQYMDRFIAEELEEESMMNIDFPNIYNLFTYIASMHSIDFSFTGEISGSDEGEFFQGKFDLISQNTTLSLLPIVVFVLVIGGVILGYYIEKNKLPFWKSILQFSFVYGLFLMISSSIAGFTFISTIDIYYSMVDINIKGTFPLIESFLMGVILAATISGLAAFLKIHGKNVFSFVKTQASYLQYAIYSIGISIFGLSLFSAFFLVFSEGIYEDIPEVSGATPSQLLAGPMGMWTWNLSHFIPLNFKAFDSEEREAFTLQLFSSFEELSVLDLLYSGDFIKELFLLENGVPLLLKVSFLIPAVLLVWVGYHLYHTHKLSIIELLKFSAIYGGVMALTRFFSTLKVSASISGEELFGLEEFLLQIQPNILPVFIISALFALVFIAAGGCLNRYLSGPVN
ncbi:hypothetical protein SAMN04487975_12413 [Planococcus glaciei]|uniref:zinc ribbon domain-containing protein n=1 Tax=Planococcus glaciei TaxID=459472 RepID=UPI000889F768|nr:zinc ribbon domain-containing protein [Planococcus glaciei]SDI64575.1 hypothetical protein SAMN04487975_12413 [Planococcus glaciei]